ncbi:hypothetical protein OKW27_007062 [Paraburkholderia sp. 35.1]
MGRESSKRIPSSPLQGHTLASGRRRRPHPYGEDPQALKQAAIFLRKENGQ